MNLTEIENFIIGRLYCGQCGYEELLQLIKDRPNVDFVLEQSVVDDLWRLSNRGLITYDEHFVCSLTEYGILYYESKNEELKKAEFEPEKTILDMQSRINTLERENAILRQTLSNLKKIRYLNR